MGSSQLKLLQRMLRSTDGDGLALVLKAGLPELTDMKMRKDETKAVPMIGMIV